MRVFANIRVRYGVGMSASVRRPAVAGRFYPGEADVLARDVQRYLAAGAPTGSPVRAREVMAPHAGYVYSGGVAGATFAAVHVPERVIVLCPNHTGLGARIAVANADAFAIPGATIPIDRALADALLEEIPGAEPDLRAHLHEHAIEVELPFLLARQPALRIVPVVLSGLSEMDAIALGEHLHRAIQSVSASGGDDVLVVASSDMNHFAPDAETREIDQLALAPLLAFDPSGLYRAVVANDISMCGFIPATAMLSYARLTNADAPQLVGYATSGDAFGDRSRVVGYAGVVVPAQPT